MRENKLQVCSANHQQLARYQCLQEHTSIISRCMPGLQRTCRCLLFHLFACLERHYHLQ
jgi:hypothetical protein